MVDLSSRSTAAKSRTGARMPVCDFDSDIPLTHKAEGDEEEREMFLVLLGPESENTRRALSQMQHKADQNKGNHSPSDAQIAEDLRSDCKMLAQLTVGGEVFWEGQWWDVTPENVVPIYEDLLLLRGQAIAFCLNPKKYVKE